MRLLPLLSTRAESARYLFLVFSSICNASSASSTLSFFCFHYGSACRISFPHKIAEISSPGRFLRNKQDTYLIIDVNILSVIWVMEAFFVLWAPKLIN